MMRLILCFAPVVVALAAAPVIALECQGKARLTAVVEVTPPGPIELLGVTVAVKYPPDWVSLPNGDATKERMKGRPTEHMSSIADADGTLRVALAHATKTLGRGRLFEVEFTRCDGTPPPAAGAFECRVESAAQETGALVEGATCKIVVEGDK